ncbi:putative signal transducing protein [Gallaecimonas pentaromativorans]|uniref:Putative signal transducing protein n=1 Tax=Gallaecimonas pentaromativorans TaxID=584787 RepID=A0A3N1P6K3_9GAMM|nr:DUF2007 domain-containing protein [Gallaecimonas pentaromativorans]ROQ27624.1 putative signal transducing protein [Gallaecimonas pentaromativorans]
MSETLLYTATNTLEAHLLQGLLAGEGIKVRLDSDLLMGGVGDLPANVQHIRLWCYSYHLLEAQAVLEGYFNHSGQDWYCGQCGEHNGSAFELCWHCQAPKKAG